MPTLLFTFLILSCHLTLTHYLCFLSLVTDLFILAGRRSISQEHVVIGPAVIWVIQSELVQQWVILSGDQSKEKQQKCFNALPSLLIRLNYLTVGEMKVLNFLVQRLNDDSLHVNIFSWGSHINFNYINGNSWPSLFQSISVLIPLIQFKRTISSPHLCFCVCWVFLFVFIKPSV